MQVIRGFLARFFSVENLTSLVLGTVIMSLAGTMLIYVIGLLPDPRKDYWPFLAAFLCLLVITGVSLLISKSHRSALRPQLTGSIDRIQVMSAAQFTKVPEHQRSMAVLLTVSIRNKGTPSIADKWELAIHIKDAEHTVKTLPVYLPPLMQINVHDTVTGGITPLVGADALYNKAVIAPIATGAMIRGILLYIVNDVTEPMLTIPGTKYILEFVDIDGRTHEIAYPWPAIPDRRSGYMAGMLQTADMGMPVISEPLPAEPSSKPSS